MAIIIFINDYIILTLNSKNFKITKDFNFELSEVLYLITETVSLPKVNGFELQSLPRHPANKKNKTAGPTHIVRHAM